MRITSLAATVALFAPPATTLTAAGCTCSLIGFENGLTVDLEVPAGPAMYRVEVDADGEVLALAYEVTATGHACLLGCRVTGSRMILSDSFPSDGQGLAVNVERIDGPDGPDGPAGPATATVRVFRGEALAAEVTFEPRYETDHPNGRGCGERVHASAALTVP